MKKTLSICEVFLLIGGMISWVVLYILLSLFLLLVQWYLRLFTRNNDPRSHKKFSHVQETP